MPLLFLDLDGTLIDSQAAVRWALARVLAEHGYDPVSDEEYHQGRHGGTRYSFGLRGLDVEACFSRFREIHDNEAISRTKLFPGAIELLDHLAAKQYRIATITLRYTRVAELLLKALGIRDRFELVAGQDWPSVHKPDPAHLREAMLELGVTAEEVLLVGDTDIDRLGATSAGVQFIGVTWGSGTPKELAGGDAIVSEFSALRSEIERLLPP